MGLPRAYVQLASWIQGMRSRRYSLLIPTVGKTGFRALLEL
jgi:hypothetical protein